MEKISSGISPQPAISKFEESVVAENQVKNKLKKGFLNYAGIFVGVFLMFAVVVIVTTDISLTSFEELAALGLDFFLLLFCSYSMYINCSDSGMRTGLASKLYTDALSTFETYKKSIVERRLQARLPEFCRHFVEEELRNSRLEILAIVGISYEVYLKEYISLSEEDVDARADLSKPQREAIKKANAEKPIKLTPEMIMKRGRGSYRRSPLGWKPESKKYLNFGIKFVTTFLVALVMSMIVLDVIIEPTWVIFASVILKLLAVVMNGFSGYKFGYENIVFDTVNYMNDQVDLMRQAIQYMDDTPLVEPEKAPPEAEEAAEKPSLS